MTRIVELKDEAHVFFCNCKDTSHHILVSWDNEDPSWRFLEIISDYRPESLWGRTKAAWKVIANKGFCTGEIFLDSEAIEELIEVLNEKV